jgi:hypothetical protein
MSVTLATSCGSVENLKVSARHGCSCQRPHSRGDGHMRDVVEVLGEQPRGPVGDPKLLRWRRQRGGQDLVFAGLGQLRRRITKPANPLSRVAVAPQRHRGTRTKVQVGSRARNWLRWRPHALRFNPGVGAQAVCLTLHGHDRQARLVQV